MSLNGVSSGVFEVKSPADKFFRSVAFDRNSPLDNIEDNMEMMSLEGRTMRVKMSDFIIWKNYKTVKTTIKVSPKADGDGSYVTWIVEFEKIRHDIEDPHRIIDTHIIVLENYLNETDEKLLR